MHWFVFTSTGGFATIQAETITQAVSGFRRIKHRNAGEIIGIIRGAASMELPYGVHPTPVFGVVCCVAESGVPQAIRSNQKE